MLNFEAISFVTLVLGPENRSVAEYIEHVLNGRTGFDYQSDQTNNCNSHSFPA